MALGTFGPSERCREARGQAPANPSLIRKISGMSDRIEITTNSSRILTLEKNIPRVQVNNPELLTVTPLSSDSIQIAAKKPGVTQVNMWDEDDNVYTVDVLIYGDVKELEHALQLQYPNSSIKVIKYTDSLLLKGYVDRPEYITQIRQLAEDYAPKVINNMELGGVQQVLLKVKVFEVSRTKLRELGVDWAYDASGGGFAFNSINDIFTIDGGDFFTNNADTFSFGILHGGDALFVALDALEEHRVAKILAEPNIVAVSGRPAKFISGGEFAYVVPQGGGGNTTFTTQFKEFGTIIDFVPIVLGNGNIRLEVRPEVSTVDFTLSANLGAGNTEVPGLRKRYVETAVEMKAGQTFALAGLVEQRVDTSNRGLPIVASIPILGLPFRNMNDKIDEIELLILVTPELIDPLDPHEAPHTAPGLATVSPNNKDFYLGGHVEVPIYANPTHYLYACPHCGMHGQAGPCQHCGSTIPMNGMGTVITDGPLPGGTGLDDGTMGGGAMYMSPSYNGGAYAPAGGPIQPTGAGRPSPVSSPLRVMPMNYGATADDAADAPAAPLPASDGESEAASPPALTNPFQPGETSGGMSRFTPAGTRPYEASAEGSSVAQPAVESSVTTAPRPYSPQRTPIFSRNTLNPHDPAGTPPATAAEGMPELIGPLGYDVQ